MRNVPKLKVLCISQLIDLRVLNISK